MNTATLVRKPTKRSGESRLIKQYMHRPLSDLINTLSTRGVAIHFVPIGDTVASVTADADAGADSIPAAKTNDPLLNAEGGCLFSSGFAKALGTSVPTVLLRLKNGKIIGTATSVRGSLFPRWQIYDGRLLPDLDKVLAHLVEAGENDRDQMRWFLSENSDLAGKRPLDLMRNGKHSDVVWAAKVLASVNR